MRKELAGEFLGTFVLVFIGLFSIVAAEFLGWLSGLWQVALFWGIGVSLAIYLTRAYSHSHLNPAVSFAFLLVREISAKQFFYYFFFQIVGAVGAGGLLLVLFDKDLAVFESANEIVRGTLGSERTAMAFGEFFPNPAFKQDVTINHITAIWTEAFGTFLLAMVILLLYRVKEIRGIFPVFVGMTVSSIILLIAPFTQAGLNPARDFGPRVVAFFGGWGEAALPDPQVGLLTVYILGPFIGALFAFLLYSRFFREKHD
jgi:glycerol uptake facilitator protein